MSLLLLNNTHIEKTEKHLGQYQFINPLLECEGSEELISWELESFQDRMEELISEKIEEGMVKDVSVYFKDLNDGPWFGINEEKTFKPGSLLKVPILMAYLKEAEHNPTILSKELEFGKDLEVPKISQYINPAISITPRKSYPIKELLYMLITYSDNNALFLLRHYEDEQLYSRVYYDFGFVSPYDQSVRYDITVKDYAGFFRVLYNASYMSRESSNNALKLLSNTAFSDGLVAGIHPDIPVAHKFGESRDEEDEKHFHDCGIIYYPGYPYLLCVMTEGKGPEELMAVIRDISAMAFKEVDGQIRRKRGN